MPTKKMKYIEALWLHANASHTDDVPPLDAMPQAMEQAIERMLWEAQKDWERDRWEFIQDMSSISPGDLLLVDYGDNSRSTFTVRIIDGKNLLVEDQSGRIHDLKRPRTGGVALVYRMAKRLPEEEGSVIRVYSIPDYPRLHGIPAVRTSGRWAIPQLNTFLHPDSDILIWSPFNKEK